MRFRWRLHLPCSATLANDRARMRRVRQPNRLPSLKAALPGFRGLPAEQTQTYALLQVLRELTQRLRSTEAQPFYSTRAAALFFGVPQPTVVQVYRELEMEGLLVRLRSVGTLLQPRKRQPRVPVRGVVGLPIWQWGYCHLAEWRRFFVQMEENLARHHLVADFIFYSAEIGNQEQFLERLLSHHLDYLLWYKPLPGYKSMLLTLRDGGVQVVVLLDHNYRLPFPSYRLDLDTATLKGLRDWQRSGLTTAVVLSLNSPAAMTPQLLPLIAKAGLRAEVITTSEAEFPSQIARLQNRRETGVLLCDEALACAVSYRQPGALSELLGQHRVLMRALLNADPAHFPHRRVDMVHFNWDKLAARIADDLASGRFRQHRTPVVLPAKLHLRAAAAAFAHAY